jgi:hypothetical protein
MKRIKLTSAGLVVALIVGLSLALSQTVLLAQQETPAVVNATKVSNKVKHKVKGKGKGNSKGIVKKQDIKGENKVKEASVVKTESPKLAEGGRIESSKAGQEAKVDSNLTQGEKK